MKKVPTATCALRDRYKVSIEQVYTPSMEWLSAETVIPRMLRSEIWTTHFGNPTG